MVPLRKSREAGFPGLSGWALVPPPSAIEPGGKDPGVVEDDQVIRSQQVWKVAELAVMQVLLAAIQMKQPRGRPVHKRLLGDEFLRK